MDQCGQTMTKERDYSKMEGKVAATEVRNLKILFVV
jgi:hypothetical protein